MDDKRTNERDDALAVVILAAGKGTRMQSELPKVLHPVAGRPMLAHAVEAAQGLHPKQVLVVVGYGADLVQAQMGETLDYALQEPQLGTGHALQVAMPALHLDQGELIVSYGDMPLLNAKILQALRDARRASAAAAVVLTTTMDPPPAFGRIVRDAQGQLAAIVEDRDCCAEQKAITEVNVAVYAFALAPLRQALSQLRNDNAQGEYYLTDVIGLMRAAGERVEALRVDDAQACLGVNSLDDLALVEQILEAKKLTK